jgi:methyl-accepting chemotaxis protein
MDKGDPTRDVSLLLRELETATRDARVQIRGDLERVRSVVRDAAANLDLSFRTLQDVLLQHRSLLETVAGALYATDIGGKSYAQTSDDLLRQFVDQIVRVSRDSMRIIDQIGDMSTNVDGIVGCADGIDRLGRETRFIAFNARIETHRAGEAGRTFKVVADEVKRLANASVGLSSKIRQSVALCRTQLEALGGTAQGLASHDLGGAIDAHKVLASAVTKLDETHTALEAILEKVETSVSTAVQTLQFEDMVSQLIATSLKRIDTMSELCMNVLRAMERGHNGDRAAPIQEAIDAMRKLATAGSGHQSSMDRGAVELV